MYPFLFYPFISFPLFLVYVPLLIVFKNECVSYEFLLRKPGNMFTVECDRGCDGVTFCCSLLLASRPKYNNRTLTSSVGRGYNIALEA